MHDAITEIGEMLSPVDRDDAEPLRGVPSTAAIAGHPIHPMLIPYPVAFLTSAVATDLMGRSSGDPFWNRASATLLRAGLVGGIAAGLVGAIDFFTIKRARTKPVGRLHAYGNVAALALAGLSLALRRDGERPSDAAMGTALATATLVGLTGWAGAELSYRHMVGVYGHGDQTGHAEKQVSA
jgi:uncharacterized membrane protein